MIRKVFEITDTDEFVAYLKTKYKMDTYFKKSIINEIIEKPYSLK